MITPVIKDYHVINLHPVESERPDWDPNYIKALVEVEIGLPTEESSSIYYFLFVTQYSIKHLDNEFKRHRGLVVLETFGLREIEEHLNYVCDKCSGIDWNDIHDKLINMSEWEYERHN